MKFIILLFSVFSITHASDRDWFKDNVQILCRGMEYDKHCERNGQDGWYSQNFVDKNTKKAFGYYSHTEFGPFYRFYCGDSFHIKDESLNCERFVEEVRKKNQECGNCLEVQHDGGG